MLIIIIINKLLAYLGILYMNCDLILSRWSKSSTTVTFRLNWGKKKLPVVLMSNTSDIIPNKLAMSRELLSVFSTHQTSKPG